jgi:hypothetical protein
MNHQNEHVITAIKKSFFHPQDILKYLSRSWVMTALLEQWRPIVTFTSCHIAQFRWNGRMFLTLGLLGALTGLYLTWVRGSRLSDIGSIGLTLNGLLILLAANPSLEVCHQPSVPKT